MLFTTKFLRFTSSDFSRIEAGTTLVDAESRKTAKAFNPLPYVIDGQPLMSLEIFSFEK